MVNTLEPLTWGTLAHTKTGTRFILTWLTGKSCGSSAGGSVPVVVQPHSINGTSSPWEMHAVLSSGDPMDQWTSPDLSLSCMIKAGFQKTNLTCWEHSVFTWIKGLGPPHECRFIHCFFFHSVSFVRFMGFGKSVFCSDQAMWDQIHWLFQ